MPSTDESRGASAFAFANTATYGPPLVSQGWPLRPSFRHAFTRSHCALGPLAVRVFAGGSSGHMPPIDFCNGKDPRAHQRTEQASPLLYLGRIRSSASGRFFFRSRASRIVSGQGLRPPFGWPVFNPHCGDRSPRWIYPNLIDPDTPAREQMPDAYWNRVDVERPRGDRPPLVSRPELRRAP
jgi:hypothetical protein